MYKRYPSGIPNAIRNIPIIIATTIVIIVLVLSSSLVFTNLFLVLFKSLEIALMLFWACLIFQLYFQFFDSLYKIFIINTLLKYTFNAFKALI